MAPLIAQIARRAEGVRSASRLAVALLGCEKSSGSVPRSARQAEYGSSETHNGPGWARGLPPGRGSRMRGRADRVTERVQFDDPMWGAPVSSPTRSPASRPAPSARLSGLPRRPNLGRKGDMAPLCGWRCRSGEVRSSLRGADRVVAAASPTSRCPPGGSCHCRGLVASDPRRTAGSGQGRPPAQRVVGMTGGRTTRLGQSSRPAAVCSDAVADVGLPVRALMSTRSPSGGRGDGANGAGSVRGTTGSDLCLMAPGAARAPEWTSGQARIVLSQRPHQVRDTVDAAGPVLWSDDAGQQRGRSFDACHPSPSTATSASPLTLYTGRRAFYGDSYAPARSAGGHVMSTARLGGNVARSTAPRHRTTGRLAEAPAGPLTRSSGGDPAWWRAESERVDATDLDEPRLSRA